MTLTDVETQKPQARPAPVTVATAPPAVAAGTCPLCHTVDSITAATLATGGGWRCAVCHQRWDAGRLDTVAAYDQFMAARAARPAQR